MLRTLSDKNFLMIGSQPIQSEIQKLQYITQKIQEENYEIEYFFDMKIAELQEAKARVLTYNKEKIRAL